MKIISAAGQTCNQFWIYSNYIADSLEKKEKIAIWLPDISLRYYPNFLKSEFISFPLYSEYLIKKIGYKNYMQLLKTIFSSKYVITICKVVFHFLPQIRFISADVKCDKSKFRNKHLVKIKSIFTPDKSITDEVEHVLSKLRKRYDVIVGVHIRYGDYRTFMDGKYFYTLAEYENMMCKITDFFPGEKVAFLITSNENISTSYFSSLNCFVIPNSFSIKDLHGLSQTDYIIGPPSTFSAWASLYGDIPLYFIENSKNNFTRDSFKKIQDVWF